MNRIKTYISGVGKNTRVVLLAIAVIFAGAGIAQATAVVATTIGANIATTGTLSVTGLSSFGQASSTMLSVLGPAYFGTTATSTFDTDGSLALLGGLTGTTASFNSTLHAGGATTLGSTLSVTGLSSLSNASSTMLSANTAYFGQTATSTFDAAGDLAVKGTLQAGSDGTALTHMVVGYCSIASATVAASSTAYADCTTSATISTSDRVFVTATDTLNNFIIEAASSTSASNIQVRILNTGMIAGTEFGNHSLSFWAIH